MAKWEELYLRRVLLADKPEPTLEGLRALHRAQLHSIPFETIAPFLSAGVSLEAEALDRKLLQSKRGGYCFELNGLFLRALHAFGFKARPLLARVMIGASSPGPLTHQISLVTIKGEPWIADVGFGGPGIRAPILLKEGIVEEGSRLLRLVRGEDADWRLEQDTGEGFAPIYGFDLRSVREIDREMGNHFTSTWPKSLFKRRLMAARFTERGRITLDDLALRTYEGAELKAERLLVNANELREALLEQFGIEVMSVHAEALYERVVGLANAAVAASLRNERSVN